MLMLQSVNGSAPSRAKGRQEDIADAKECRSSRTRIIKNRILMPHSVNSCNARMFRDTILMLQSVEVAGRELSGVL
jgi:hypothetical protein